MKLLIDCSNLNAGGGIQVGLSFLYDLQECDTTYVYYVIMSPNFSKALNRSRINSKFILCTLTKKSNNIVFRSIEVRKIEKKIDPDIIFSVFGPSYHFSSYPRVMGYAIPHYIYVNSPFFTGLTLRKKIRLTLFKAIQIYLFKKADRLIFETNDAKRIFCEKYSYSPEKAEVVGNRLNQIFIKQEEWRNHLYNFHATHKILCLTANYEHKNLKIIPQVIDHLVDKGLQDFKFVISIKKEELNFPNYYHKYIEYLGKVPLENLPPLYKSVSLLFMPSLLECFSTTYLEAMKMEIPIVTTDLGFARDVCNDAALYYQPLNAQNAADHIGRLLKDLEESKRLVQNGQRNLQRFGNSMDRTRAYLKIIQKEL